MKLCEKRSIALYFLLRERFQDKEFDLGEAWDVAKGYFTKKVFLNVFKRLVKLGLATRISTGRYRLEDVCKLLEDVSREYLDQRSRSASSSSS